MIAFAQFSRNVQAESSATVFGGVERLEDMLCIRCRNAGAVVFYIKVGVVTEGGKSEVQLYFGVFGVVTAMAYGVVAEVGNHLVEVCGIHSDVGLATLYVDGNITGVGVVAGGKFINKCA